MAQVEELHKRQAMDTATILERDDDNTQRVLDRIDNVKDQFEETAKKVLVLGWRSRAGALCRRRSHRPGDRLVDADRRIDTSPALPATWHFTQGDSDVY